MNADRLTEHTLIGRVTRKFRVPLTIYSLYLALINILALGLAAWDPKGLVVVVVTLGFSLQLHLSHSRRQEQRLTNELLEELLERRSPLSRVEE